MDPTWTAIQIAETGKGFTTARMRCLPHTHLRQGFVRAKTARPCPGRKRRGLSLALRERLQSNDNLRTETGRPQDDIHGRLVTRSVDEIRPHPSYLRHHLAVSASQLSALEERGDLAFKEPIVITRNGFIVDGYARRELARLQGPGGSSIERHECL